jgi:hypothetical protein
MNFAMYQSIDAVNWSSLKHLWSGSPKLYKHRLDTDKDEPTAAMTLGRATHLAVFEPDRLPLECAVWTEGDRRGNAWKAFKEANEGRIILKADEYDDVIKMRDAVRANPDVIPYLASGTAEHALMWTDDETSMDCKARLDFLNLTHADGPVIVDLKTSNSIETRRFSSVAARLGYHLQAAHYLRGLKAAHALPFARFVIIAVESSAPYDSVVYEYETGDLRAATEELAGLLVKLKHHRDTDTWPGRYSEPQTLPIPPWVYGEGQAEITFTDEE